MRAQILLMAFAFAVIAACDDGNTDPTLAGTDGGAPVEVDGSIDPDTGAPRHEWYVAEGPGGPVVQIPIAYPQIGGLYVHTREMSNAEARALGADIPADAIGSLPVLVDWATAAAIANAASMRDGLEPCYQMPIGERPGPRPCDGWRLATADEWRALVDDALPSDEEWAGLFSGDRCADALDARGVCYRCACPDGPMPVGASDPNRFGMQDLLGNAPDRVAGGGVIGGGWLAHWSEFRGGSALEEIPGDIGGIRLVSLPPL